MTGSKDTSNKPHTQKKPVTGRANKIQETVFNRLKRVENFKVVLTNGDELQFNHILSSDNFTIIGVLEGEKEMTMLYKHDISRIKNIPMTDKEKSKYT